MLQFEARKLASSSPAELHRLWTSAECDLLREVMTYLILDIVTHLWPTSGTRCLAAFMSFQGRFITAQGSNAGSSGLIIWTSLKNSTL